jgi:RNA polymerase sigma factor (sigma-70 family)
MSPLFGTICDLLLGIIPGILFLKSHTYQPGKKNTFDNLKDEELINQYQKDLNQYQIAILFDRYIHLVFASCMKYLKEEEAAQDAAMEIFESIPEKILKHKIEHFKSWLYITTKNHCLMQLRKQKPIDRIEKIENFVQLSVENEDFLHLDNKEDDNHALIMKCLSELKEEQKLCIELMYLKGKSYKDIADNTGFELKHVKSYIQNGKRNLKAMLEKHYEQQERK